MQQPFEQAVAQHGAVVLRVCRAVLGPVEADDAWSETFLAALRAWPGLPEETNVRAWLVTVAHRKALDERRAEARRPVPVERRADGAPESSAPWSHAARRADGRGPHHDGPESALPDECLWAALAALPPRQRLCVAYHHVAGLTHAEVARIAGGTEAASRRAAADGIATLRRTYQHHREE